MGPSQPAAPLVAVAIAGRVTREAIDALAHEVQRALDAGGPFAVLFDRAAMTAPTPGGRDALDHWWQVSGPAIGTHCVGWADLYDARRAASLQSRQASDTYGTDAPADGDAPPYPHRVFADRDKALAWLRPLRETRPRPTAQPPTAPPETGRDT